MLYSMQMKSTTTSCRFLLARFPCHWCAMQDACPPFPLRTWSIHTRSMPYANRMRHRMGRSCQLVTCLPFGSGLMLRTQHSLAQRRTQCLLVQLLRSMLPLPLASSAARCHSCACTCAQLLLQLLPCVVAPPGLRRQIWRGCCATFQGTCGDAELCLPVSAQSHVRPLSL